MHRLIGGARIFSFGVGNSVNRYLLDGLATEGRGAAAYLALEDSADEVMSYFFERISHPALTDVSIDWRGLAVSEVYPRRIPDLFVGRPVMITGQFKGGAETIAVHGRAGKDSLTFQSRAGRRAACDSDAVGAAQDRRSRAALRMVGLRGFRRGHTLRPRSNTG